MAGGNIRNGKTKPFWISARSNNTAFLLYYQWLTELAVSMFEWQNLPDTIDERYLELALYSTGQAIFFKDPVMGYLGLRCTIGGGFNVYGIPKQRIAMGYNGYQHPCSDEDSVIIYNNYMRRPSMGEMEEYAQRISNITRAIDVNANAQKTPILITCEESQKLSMQAMYEKYQGDEPVIFGYKGIDKDNINVLTTDAPYVADKLYTLKTQLWNEALTKLGVSNLNSTKKERLVADEVTRNMGAVIASRYSRLEMRRKACEEINDMFGLDIDVDFRQDYREQDDEVMLSGETGDGGIDTMVTDLRTRTARV